MSYYSRVQLSLSVFSATLRVNGGLLAEHNASKINRFFVVKRLAAILRLTFAFN